MEKIDFVLPWVDGGDPDWIKQKSNYTVKHGMDNSLVRYRDWENLAYWFRGVEKHAPWVDRIFLITWGHLPQWLNLNHPKLRIVRHDDYIPHEYLPTFKSETIELNIHRIKELSEEFVYFNDDIFIINKTDPEDFFSERLPCDSIALEVSLPSEELISRVIYNDTAIINKHFKKRMLRFFRFKNIRNLNPKVFLKSLMMMPFNMFSGFHNPHLPNSFTKSIFQEVWQKEFYNLDQTCRRKFRSPEDINQWLMRYWLLAKGEFSFRRPKFGRYFEITEDNSDLLAHIRARKSKVVCCNDTAKFENFEHKKKELNQALRNALPDKSSFEL